MIDETNPWYSPEIVSNSKMIRTGSESTRTRDEKILTNQNFGYSVSDTVVQKAMVTVAIEKVLLDIGKPIYDKVWRILYTEYHCYLPDCYDHPEYLADALRQTYGISYKSIIKNIERELIEFSYKHKIQNFLTVIVQ
ncbi:MAG: hypothetical protein KGI10_01270 [Thaumarchaeota archaeon]|nr:hypothetical protein [Nitrososphaerota archaeon]